MKFLLRFFLLTLLASMPALVWAQPEVSSAPTRETKLDSAPAPTQATAKDPGDKDAAYDPLEPFNRVMYHVNDFIYFGILKPIARVYVAITPEAFRLSVQRFFHNLAMPKHFLNALLQGKPDLAGRELGRFAINTVIGGLGFFDPAASQFDIYGGDEDVGQTLGTYGLGEGPYLMWPIIGPSNLRDTIGTIGDTALSPTTYFPEDFWPRAGIHAYDTVNDTSLKIGEYEGVKESAIDPYVAIRDAYKQMRRDRIGK